ncbi:hypothetical protein F4553_000714 [Allocatelliglobosispora scoriae]|uniref:Uncharacterized protein n=1 Tax=Allocatelliglobosispora scoriae TaxID=643052 RepID=A0A841BI91_9ACTN|nr:hypothetical protein [Allocatelliglobosispora scoriae]MBB5867335.1 hypothetical protein [Allocatelliglobosispora scoriae]
MSLRPAIEQLYRVFAAYPLRDAIAGCPCCTSDLDQRDLHTAPLRDLTVDHLRHFAFSALFTFGDLADLKHFLPRLFELAALESFHGPDLESLYGRLTYGGLPSWPAHEVAAVRAFTAAHWDAALAGQTASSADEVLCGALLIGEEPEPYLRRWGTSAAHTEELLSFLRTNTGAIIDRRMLQNAYYGQGTLAAQQRVVAWLLDPARVTAFTAEFLATSDPVHAEAVTALEPLAASMCMPVEDVFTGPKGELVVTGRVAGGVVATGDRIGVLGSGTAETTMVREVLTGICHRGPARAGHNTALVVDPVAVRPGDTVYRD